MLQRSAGLLLRETVKNNTPLQIAGAINAYAAMMAEKIGFKALYLSGSGVASASYGLPDLGITTMNDVLEDVRRITKVTKLPLLVDIDTGWGSAYNISRTITEFEKAGAAGVHIEDQVAAKRCGHRPGKQIVSKQEMVDRIKSAIDGRKDPNFVIMARTDAFAREGMEKALDRAEAYIAAGADMLFPEALQTLDQFKSFTSRFTNTPILANITEFGKTPYLTKEELHKVGVGIILYPLSAFRAMNKAAENVYKTILNEGTQKNVINTMQTRDELYKYLEYEEFEKKIR